MKTKKEQYEAILTRVRDFRATTDWMQTGVFFVSAHYASPQWVRLSHILKQCSDELAEWLKDNEDQEPN